MALVEERQTHRGRALYCAGDVPAGGALLAESPLVCAQFSWNRLCKYRACSHCLRSLEPAQDMARRLSGIPDFELPMTEICDIVKPAAYVTCLACDEIYCAPQCRDEARQQYHGMLCTQGLPDHPLVELDAIWREIHPPPETISIQLLVRLLARICTEPGLNAQISAMCSDYECEFADIGVVRHKLTEPQFAPALAQLRERLLQLFSALGHDSNPALHQWLSMDGFLRLWALCGRNGAGIGTSSLAHYDRRLSALDLPETQRAQCDALMEQLYEQMHEHSGHFLDCEGSGLYAVHSACNHSCEPNAEVSFNDNSHLTLQALRDIAAGEEILISYLEEPILRSSRNTRQEILRQNYLFECDCFKCQRQIDNPDESDPEEDDEDDAEEEEDEHMHE